MKNIPSPLGAHTLFTFAFLFMILTVSKSLQPRHYISAFSDEKDTNHGVKSHMPLKEGAKEDLGMQLYPTGSSLPDCSHACGPCFPCKRVMVSFKCSIESCPIVYRCMCKGKYYHVPSN